MDYLVEFLEVGARVIKDPLLIEKKKDLPNVLLNPDLSHLRGVSPSFWVKDGAVVGSLTPEQSRKIVMESLDDGHSYDTIADAPFSKDSKIMAKIEQIDAQQDAKIKKIEFKIVDLVDELYSKIGDLQLDLELQEKLHAEQIKSLRKSVMGVGFLCTLALLLLKFL